MIDYSVDIANALEILQSCTKPSTWYIAFWWAVFNDILFHNVYNAMSQYRYSSSIIIAMTRHLYDTIA